MLSGTQGKLLVLCAGLMVLATYLLSDGVAVQTVREGVIVRLSSIINTPGNWTWRPVTSRPRRDYNVISMSLYGSNPRYTAGAQSNVRLRIKNFPGWVLRFYVPSKKFPQSQVPEKILRDLRAHGAEIQYVDNNVYPMMWRFLVATDTNVTRFIVRDADSRLTHRDWVSVQDWVKSGKPVHCQRDHRNHGRFALNGGMWGAETRPFHRLMGRATIERWRHSMGRYQHAYIMDMNFLNKEVWPKVKNHIYCSDSVTCKRWPGAHPFRTKRVNTNDFVGNVYSPEIDFKEPPDKVLTPQMKAHLRQFPRECNPYEYMTNTTV